MSDAVNSGATEIASAGRVVDAEFICRAANAHEALVELAEFCRNSEDPIARRLAEYALKLARGEQS